MSSTKNGWRIRLCKIGDEAMRREAGNSGIAAYYQPLNSTLYTSKLQTKAPTDLTDLHGNTEYVKDNTDNK